MARKEIIPEETQERANNMEMETQAPEEGMENLEPV